MFTGIMMLACVMVFATLWYHLLTHKIELAHIIVVAHIMVLDVNPYCGATLFFMLPTF